MNHQRVPVLGQKTCQTCKFFHKQAAAMVCTLNPPVAFPIMGTTPDGQPVIQGWISSYPPAPISPPCGQYKLALFEGRDNAVASMQTT